MNRRRLQLLIGAVAVVAAACSGGGPPGFVHNPECAGTTAAAIESPLPVQRVGLNVDGRTLLIDAEVAENDTARLRGLMCRSEVSAGTGMIFRFPGPTTGPFWMFNTYVPLDIVYFGRNGGAIHIARMNPCTRAGSESESEWRARCLEESKSYAPPGPYAGALELPADWLASEGVQLSQPPTGLNVIDYGRVGQ